MSVVGQVDAVGHPRSRAVRIALTSAMLVGMVLAATLPQQLILYRLYGRGPLTDVLAIVLPAALTAVFARRVSYRRRDAIAWVIPVLGILLAARLAWRLAYLPYRDWPPRPDEVERYRETPFRGRSGSPLYMLAPASRVVR